MKKDEKRAQRKLDRQARRENPQPVDSGGDPDIADIIPGPQPPRY
jgi:hypothetical protein